MSVENNFLPLQTGLNILPGIGNKSQNQVDYQEKKMDRGTNVNTFNPERLLSRNGYLSPPALEHKEAEANWRHPV